MKTCSTRTRVRPCGLPISNARRQPISAAPSLATGRLATALFLIISVLLLLPVPAAAAHNVQLIPRGPQTTAPAAVTAKSTQEPAAATKSTPTGIAVDPQATELRTLPRPLDGAGIASNVTSECNLFLKSLINTPDFLDCYPLSMLLIGSESYFNALTKGPFAVTTVVDKTCNPVPNFDTCASLSDRYAVALRSSDNCADDYDALNPVVQQAYYGLVSYRTVYAAGCLKSDGGNYCYTEAVTNRQAPSDPTIYFLPLGKPLPEDAKPNCSKCLKETMDLFTAPAGNSTQPLSKVYAAASQQINRVCGANFTQDSVQSSGGRLSPKNLASSFALAVPVLLFVVFAGSS